ncbi:MAG: hypothetical protein SV910_02260 [Chloroflexota bacterium]|nr:hypothetical protein [Chloroflexota bacterium]
MDKVVTTALLIIAGIICTVFIFNSVYPMVNRSSEAMVSMAENIDERMKSSINIVHAASSSDRLTHYVWVKNVGDARITTIERSDVFFGKEGSFSRVPHTSEAGASYPRWSYTIENDAEWKKGATVKITITYDVDPGTGTYFVKVIIPNGIADEYYFSI